MTNYDLSKVYIQYNEGVLSGEILVGIYIKQACQRMKSWFDRDDIYFDTNDVDRKIRFIGKFKHWESPFTGQPFILLPYQQWIISNIFGWKYKDSNERVIKNALLLMSRKQGKTVLASALMLCAIIGDGQQGVSGYTIANSAAQAGIAFKHISKFCKSVDPEGVIFKRYRNEIRIPEFESTIKVLSSDTTKLDGLNPFIFIQDEICEANTNAIWSIMHTGMGARKNALAIGISTTGYKVGSTYALYAMWDSCRNILNGSATDDSWFAALYQLDEDDDWRDRNVWIKACPSIGETISYNSIEEAVTGAINNPSLEVDVRTKQLNQWVNSAEVWFPREFINKCLEKVNLSDYSGEDCYMGVDFSLKKDLSAFSVLIPPNESRKLNPDKYIYKSFIYIPEYAMSHSPNRHLYAEWVRKGYAVIAEGEVVDTIQILHDQLEIGKDLYIVDCAFDAFYSVDWQTAANEQGLPITRHNQSMAAFTPTVDFFEYIMGQGKVIIDDNPITVWMLSNVEMMRNESTGTKKPRKANGDRNNKIDAVICMLEATTSCVAHTGQGTPEVWSITDKDA